jgi:hypothetical protein
MFRGEFEGRVQRHARRRFGAIANGTCGRLQLLQGRRRQAIDARFGAAGRSLFGVAAGNATGSGGR